MVSTKLSKSLFIRGLQCQKSLWLYKHNRELQKLPSETLLMLFDEGHRVGKLARELFPGGAAIDIAETIPHRLKLTQDHLKRGTQTLYEATFQYNNVLVMVDILHKGKDGWELYEVKASSHKKYVHEKDVAIQYYVLNGSGIPITNSFVVTLNNQYVLKKSLCNKKLFNITSVQDSVTSKQAFLKKKIRFLQELIKTPEEPEIAIGEHCNRPYDCDFKDYCWKKIPSYSIFNLSGLSSKKKFDLYSKNILETTQIPPAIPLTRNQLIQIESDKTGLPYIEKKNLKQFLNKFYYPLFFLDFESMQYSIPQYKNTKPFQQIPFQYSLHFKSSPFDTLNHQEFLADPSNDPRYSLAKALVKMIPEHACIITYNSSFEKRIISDLAQLYPSLEKHLKALEKKVIDLMEPFQKKYIYMPLMKGSHSIKKVLPAFAPDLSYQNLDIANGETASRAYTKLLHMKDHEEIRKLRFQLLEYCKLDTLAMVKIYEELIKIVNRNDT